MKRYKAKNLKPGTPRRSAVKTLCAVLLVVFTLALAADIGNLLLTPARDQPVFRKTGDFQSGGFTPSAGGELQRPGSGGNGGEADGEAPEGEGMPSLEGIPGGSGGRRSGLRQTLRSAWLPIALVCVLGDGLCLAVLLRARKRTAPEPEEASGMEALEEPETPRRRKHGAWAVIVCLALVFALILSRIPASGSQGSAVTAEEKVLSGVPEAARLDTVLSGAGTLEAGSLTAVTVPSQVTVLSYHVRNGETVAAGDPLVSVDKVSASAAMSELQTLLKALDKDLEAERRQENPTRLTASVSGRVKEIYVQPGDDASAALYDRGALMLLSLDGRMKVEFSTDAALTVGQTVTVAYEGGTESGRVDALREGKATVTLPDTQAPNGAEATVTDESGQLLGTGTLAPSSGFQVMGQYGTVKSLSVSVGDKVTVGRTLLTLENTGRTAEYQLLLARRQAMEAQMEVLSQLAQTGMVRAEKDGIVSGVPEGADIQLLSADGDAGNYQVLLLSHSETGQPRLVPLSAAGDGDGSTESGGGEGGGESLASGTYAAAVAMAFEGKLYVYYCPTPLSGGEDLSSLRDQMTQPGAFAYSGGVSLTQNGETTLVDISQLLPEDLLWISVLDGSVTNVQALRPASGEETPTEPVLPTEPSQPGGSGEGGIPGGGMPSGGSAGGGMSGGMAGGGMTGGGGNGGGSSAPDYETYSLEEQTLLYVSDQEEAAVTISVDELDILSLESGLEAQVTLDAMKGRSFQGTVQKLGRAGTNDGGNTKFSVTVSLPRETDMLDGMNASVKIVTATHDAALAIPAAALVEADGKTWVYTSYDEKTDTLGALREVETGASDGEYVEILSGLDSDTVFYYRYADTVTYSFLTA